MDNEIFRKKSMEKISSPEELNAYLKVTSPRTWFILCSIIIFLVGLLAWASVGRLETKASAIAVVDNQDVLLYPSSENAYAIQAGMPVYIENQQTIISQVESDEFGRIIASASLNIPDGKYNAEILIESIAPINFLFK